MVWKRELLVLQDLLINDDIIVVKKLKNEDVDKKGLIKVVV